MDIYNEELFAPVLALKCVDSLVEAIALSNEPLWEFFMHFYE